MPRRWLYVVIFSVPALLASVSSNIDACSCFDAQGREAVKVPLGEATRRPN